MKKRLFSGVQPSGELHLGNYIGALKQFVELQKKYDALYCIVDYHAITVPQDPKTLKGNTLRTAATYLALGLEPKRSIMFVQSDVAAHAELAVILNNFVYFGEASRMTQFKDKSSGKGENVSVGLFDYPVLMAADILLYDTELVPVGDDQKQHVELARNIAERFNKRFGATFVVPKPMIKEEGARIMGLDDPTKKMSKSAASPMNYISLFDNEETTRKKIMKAVTDSAGKYSENEPGISNLLTIYAELTGMSLASVRKKFKGKKYSEFKRQLADTTVKFLNDFQKKFNKYESDTKGLDRVLKDGAQRAEKIASKKLAEVKKKIGVGS